MDIRLNTTNSSDNKLTLFFLLTLYFPNICRHQEDNPDRILHRITPDFHQGVWAGKDALHKRCQY